MTGQVRPAIPVRGSAALRIADEARGPCACGPTEPRAISRLNTADACVKRSDTACPDQGDPFGRLAILSHRPWTMSGFSRTIIGRNSS